MAAETIVIDIVANFRNQTSAGLNGAKQAADRFTDSMKKAKRETDRLGGTNAKPKVGVIDKATSTLTKIDRSLRGICGKTVRAGVKIIDYATRPLRTIYNSLFSIKGLIATIGTGLVANQILMKPISLADSYSSAKIGFSNLLGESGGQKMMDDLDAFAKATPFKTSGVISNAQKMLAMGWDSKDIIKDMEIIGNAAAATGKMDQGLESIVRALSQIKTKGKLSTEELNQLSEAGIAAKAMLAEQLGYGTGDKGIAAMTKDLEKGLIGSDQAVQALLQGMKQFDGTMEKTANETVEGLKSQLEDTFEINVARRWGQGLQDGAKRGLGSILKLLDESEDGLANFGDTVYEIGKDLSNWAADKLEGTIDKILEVSKSEEFKNASFGGKLKIMWDEVVAKPFDEWWDSKGKSYVANKMRNFGEGLGSGMSKGLMALLGVDVVGATGEAASIGGSFAEGFAKGFEGKKVWDAIVDAAGRAFKSGFESLFTGTWLEKIIVGGLALKLTSGIIGTLNSIQTLWAGTGALTGAGSLTLGGMGLKGMIGTAGNSMMRGTGLLSMLANAGYGLTGGAATSTLSGGAAAAIGGVGVAGGVAAGASLYKGISDLWKAHKAKQAGDDTEYRANEASGGSTLAGVAAGAAIGSIIPGVGTAIGALVGAGVGGVAGWVGGNKWADNIRKDAAEIEAAKYASKEMQEAVKNTETSAEELAVIFDKACSDDLVERFGDIELSMEEIQKYSKQIVLGDQAKIMDKFANASQKASQSLQTFHTASEDMERLNFDMAERQWKIKAGIDVKLNDEEIKAVKERVQTFMDSAEKALSDSHYKFNVAVDVLLDGESKDGVIGGGNKLYQKLQKELDSANKELKAQYNIALKDGVITADEQKILSDYQQKVSDIIEKVSNAETEAKFEVAKINFTTGDLSADSFANLQSTLQTQMKDYVVQQEEALTVAISGLKLSKSEGAITEEQYNEQVNSLIAGYNANIEQMSAKVSKVQLEGIAEAFDGTGTVEQLQGAITALTEEGKNPVDLTFSDINAHLDISADSLTEEEKTNFTAVMREALQSSVTGENALKPEADVQAKLKANEETLASETSVVRQTALDTLQNGFTDPLSVNGTANLALKWSITSGKSATVDINGSSKTLTASLTTKKANGGYVDKPIEALIGEAGPEMIIPLSANRRQRGRALWEQAGRAMGLWNSNLIPNANGGLYGHGASRLGEMLNSAKSAGNTESTQSGSGNGSVNVEVGGVNITIQSGGNGVQEDIRSNADAIAGQIADMLKQAFQNMPLAVEG